MSSANGPSEDDESPVRSRSSSGRQSSRKRPYQSPSPDEQNHRSPSLGSECPPDKRLRLSDDSVQKEPPPTKKHSTLGDINEDAEEPSAFTTKKHHGRAQDGIPPRSRTTDPEDSNSISVIQAENDKPRRSPIRDLIRSFTQSVRDISMGRSPKTAMSSPKDSLKRKAEDELDSGRGSRDSSTSAESSSALLRIFRRKVEPAPIAIDDSRSIDQREESVQAPLPRSTGGIDEPSEPVQSHDDAAKTDDLSPAEHSVAEKTLAIETGKANEESSDHILNHTNDNLRSPPALVEITKVSDKDIEQVLQGYLKEAREDNEYWIHTCLRQAFATIEESAANTDPDPPTSVFKNLKPLTPTRSSEQPGKRTAKFKVESFHGSKTAKPMWLLDCEMIDWKEMDIPNYSHYISLRRNVLSHNETALLHWPYFSDDFNNQNYGNVRSVYFIDIAHRQRKLIALLRAENLAKYVEDVLCDLGITWTDVLHFLLDQEPDVGTSQSAINALKNRELFCEDDFMRDGKRWSGLTSKLPPSTSAKTGIAGILCNVFQQKTDFPLWHLARRSAIVTELLKEEEDNTELHEFTCRVCTRFDCPHHGEMQESLDAKEPSNRTDFNVVETDIIQPLNVNERWRVEFPATEDLEPEKPGPREKRSLHYWQQSTFCTKVDERGPFYPCHHPGQTCSEKHCTCFAESVPCEKSCSCSADCSRKYQGCLCSTEKLKKGQRMVCFEDDRCSCFQLGRECDPDLCGDCGVAEVVDPMHRHDDQILKGRCRNGNLQRGTSKHAILGESRIHGLGLYALENIREHDFVGEYRGEIITKDEAERRGAVYQHQKLSYLFTLNNTQEIDSTYFGNKVRFINHASEKDKACNLYPRIIMVNTVHRIGIYAKRKIKPGEELFFDYGPQFPNEQLGGRNAEAKSRKSAPHVRNAMLVKGFYPVAETTDKHGNVRATKAGSSTAKPSKSTARRGGHANSRAGRGGSRGRGGTRNRRGNDQNSAEPDRRSKSHDEDADARPVACYAAESPSVQPRWALGRASDTSGQSEEQDESEDYQEQDRQDSSPSSEFELDSGNRSGRSDTEHSEAT